MTTMMGISMITVELVKEGSVLVNQHTMLDF